MTTCAATEPERRVVSEGDLLAAVAGGDEESFRHLYASCASRVRALALRVVRDPSVADEVVQEAFLDIWRCAGDFRPKRGSAEAWISTIGHRRAVDRVRREETQRGRTVSVPDMPESAVAAPDHAPVVLDDIERRDWSERIRGALHSLPPAQRAVIAAIYFDGLTALQAAERLRIPLGTVKSRTLLAMRRLRSSPDFAR
jgi:RNA polymerase sigma-70 factor (ECF subfamily)